MDRAADVDGRGPPGPAHVEDRRRARLGAVHEQEVVRRRNAVGPREARLERPQGRAAVAPHGEDVQRPRARPPVEQEGLAVGRREQQVARVERGAAGAWAAQG